MNKNKEKKPLFKSYTDDKIEIGIDEAGRGPLLGRVYTAAVILPKDDSFDHSKMKDSKKFSSEKKIKEVAEYIKQNALAWTIEYCDETEIDKYNILKATQIAMHKCINKIINTNLVEQKQTKDCLLLVDGNYFTPFMFFRNDNMNSINHVCLKSGDNLYTSIAAASILAKVERDKYIQDLCDENPDLCDKYSIHTNKGYGAKKHLEGIKNHGITKWHRKSFAPCKI